MIKGSIQEEDIRIINIYAPNIGALQYVRQILTSMKEEINSNTIIVGDLNTPLTTMDRSTKQKINKETQTLKDTMDQLDLIDIYRTFHPKRINFTFFSTAHGTFSRTDHWAINLVLVNSKNWNHSSHLFWPQYSKIRSQLQEKNYWNFKHMEAK